MEIADLKGPLPMRSHMQISGLHSGEYVELEESPNFPGIPLKTVIPQYLADSKRVGRNAVIKAFRNWVRSQIL